MTTLRGALAGIVLILANGCTPPDDRSGWECLAPANAGGGWDMTCRSVAGVLSELDISPGPVRTINLPGAGGGVAFARTVSQRNEDTGLLVAASTSTALLLAQRQYGPLTADDVRWVGALGAEFGMLAVSTDSPLRTLDDLIDALRQDPGSVVVSGGSSVTGQDHMKVLLLAHRAGIDPRQVRYVPFDGGGEAMTALLGGFVDVFSGEVSEVEGQVRAGRLRMLTVLSPERLPAPYADVPTATESGLDVTWITWRGYYVPGGISDEEYDRWVGIMSRVGRSPEWEDARRIAGMNPYFQVGADFEAFVHAQVDEFEAMSREIGLIR